jgi:hypothetical protein
MRGVIFARKKQGGGVESRIHEVIVTVKHHRDAFYLLIILVLFFASLYQARLISNRSKQYDRELTYLTIPQHWVRMSEWKYIGAMRTLILYKSDTGAYPGYPTRTPLVKLGIGQFKRNSAEYEGWTYMCKSTGKKGTLTLDIPWPANFDQVPGNNALVMLRNALQLVYIPPLATGLEDRDAHIATRPSISIGYDEDQKRPLLDVSFPNVVCGKQVIE